MRDLSLHLMDIIQNSIGAHASKITVTIHADRARDRLTVMVEDNGCGMDEELLKRVKDPFVTTRTTRKVGLGIPLLDESARRSGGKLSITSVKGQGTILKACFCISHIDRIPLGNIAETFANLLMARPEIDYRLILKSGEREFEMDTSEIKQKLGDVPIESYTVVTWLKEYINEGVTNVFGGVLDEVNC